MSKENKRKYQSFKIIALVLLLLLVSSCTTKYDDKDIYEYVEKTYGLKDIHINKQRIEFEGEDGYTNYLWEVSAGDIKFHVLDDYHWGMETLDNFLVDDYKSVMLKEYYNQDILTHFTLEEKFNQRLEVNELKASFNTKEEFLSLYEELENFKSYVLEKGYTIPNSFSYQLQMQSPIRNNIETYIVDDGDSFGTVTEIDDKKINDTLINYIQVYTDYHFNDLYDKFSEEEIIDAINKSKYQIALIKDEEKQFYDDLCGSRFGYGISFGTLYEILKREGFNVSGNHEHYSFIDNDQNTYEISYDFINVDGLDNHYYYLKNGTVIKMNADFYNHFSAKEVEAMTGLKLYIGRKEA